MSTIKLNDSFSNGSLTHCAMLPKGTPLNLYVQTILLISNFIFGFPVNVWVVWLICRGPRELLALDIYLLSLAVCGILFCIGLPAQMFCMYSFEAIGDGLNFLMMVQWTLLWLGGALFQGCICVDRYMAVIHPLIYVRSKPLKYRVAMCALAWCCIHFNMLLSITLEEEKTFGFIWFVLILCTFLYCSFAVLFSLKQPGPGEREGGERKTGDKVKRKAFNLILVHLACYLINFLPMLIVHVTTDLAHIYIPDFVTSLIVNLGMFCGHLQPLLYLHRAGKFSCLKRALT